MKTYDHQKAKENAKREKMKDPDFVKYSGFPPPKSEEPKKKKPVKPVEPEPVVQPEPEADVDSN